MKMRQDPILTVTLNPALDLSARVPHMIAGPKLRLEQTRYEPGGGGVNVARAISLLEGEVLAWVALGGASGAQHLALLQAQAVPVHQFQAPGETRQSWAVTDADGRQYRLQLPGEAWDASLARAALADIVAQATGLVVLSGSQPPGVDPGFPQEIATRLGPGRLIVDTSGPALQQLHDAPDLQSRPFVLRLDQAEAEALAGQALTTAAQTIAFAKALLEKGVAEYLCVARGADGSVLVGNGAAHHCVPPQVDVVSKVGAGDSFTGAFALALARGVAPVDALCFGTAAAAAAVMTPGTELCRPEDVTKVLAACTAIGF